VNFLCDTKELTNSASTFLKFHYVENLKLYLWHHCRTIHTRQCTQLIFWQWSGWFMKLLMFFFFLYRSALPLKIKYLDAIINEIWLRLMGAWIENDIFLFLFGSSRRCIEDTRWFKTFGWLFYKLTQKNLHTSNP